MSNSKGEDELFPPEQPTVLTKRQKIPQPGYGLSFSEALAQRIAEFVGNDLFKQLKKVYALQAKDRTARQALNSAHDDKWLHYYKGIAAATDLFFEDMEAVAKAYNKENSDEDPESKKFKR